MTGLTWPWIEYQLTVTLDSNRKLCTTSIIMSRLLFFFLELIGKSYRSHKLLVDGFEVNFDAQNEHIRLAVVHVSTGRTAVKRAGKVDRLHRKTESGFFSIGMTHTIFSPTGRFFQLKW